MLSAAVAYFAMTAVVKVAEFKGNAWLVKELESFKPAWSWGITLLMLNGYAPWATKLFGGLQFLATLVISSSSLGSNVLHRRYLLYPCVGTFVALFLSAAIVGETSGAVALAIVLLHLANMAEEVVWRMTLPSPLITRFVDVKRLQQRVRQNDGVELVTFPSSAMGGVSLSGAIVRGPRQAGRPPRFLLYLGGNGELWENSLGGIASLARKVGADAAAINYRGVGSSEGISRRDTNLVEDACDMIAYLLRTEPGLEQRDIVLFGHSIGGGVACQVVTTRFPECGIVLDRSFSSLADAASGVVAGLSTKLTRPVMWSAFGLLDSETAFPKIKHDRKLVTYHREDRIVTFRHASLGRLPSFQPNGAYKKFTVELTGHCADPHNCDVTDLQGSGEVLRRMAEFYRP